MNDKNNAPNNINEIRLGDYQKYYSIIKANEGASDEFLETKLLEIFCGLSYTEIKELPVDLFNTMTSQIYNAFDVKCPLTRRFSMTGTDDATVEFGFIPNLDKITMGEYIDLNNYFEDIATLHKAMAVLFRPIHKSFKNREKYLISSYEGTEFFSNVMKDMPLGIALGAKVFFWTLGNKLLTIMLNSLQLREELQAALSEDEKKDLIASMHGIKNSMLLQEVQHYESMKLL